MEAFSPLLTLASGIKQHCFLWIQFIRRKILKLSNIQREGNQTLSFVRGSSKNLDEHAGSELLLYPFLENANFHPWGTHSSCFCQVSPLSLFALLQLVPFRGQCSWVRDFRKVCFLNCSTSQGINLARGSICLRELPPTPPPAFFFSFEDAVYVMCKNILR